MADITPVAETETVPDPALVQRAETFTRERFCHDGEDPAVALAPGTSRRRALDMALAEMDAGAKVPSTKWRRRYSLLLGLERVLSEDEPTLADGTLLNPHQVDALSGTLVALLAATQKVDDAEERREAAPVLALDDEPVAEEEPVADEEPAEDDEPDDDDDEDDDDEEPLELEELEDLDLDDDDQAPAAGADEDADSWDDDAPGDDVDEDISSEGAAEDPNAHKRFWFEHATGAGKTVAAMGFVEASRTGGVLILTHRRNLVDQFLGELRTRGYGDRESPPLLDGEGKDRVDGPVTVETYQWFVRNAGRISPAYTIVICDEAHTALGEKTSAAIREWTGPIFVGMTATGALIARHVTDLFPTQTSRFDLAQAARRGVIAPLRCIRIPPGPGVRTIAKVPLRKGDVDVEFDQEMLAELLDQLPFNMAIADLYKTRFDGVPGVVYAAGVRHAMNVAEAFRELGIKAMGVSGETPKRELAEILAQYERGEIDVLVNAQLLAEGWNSPRATICMHLAPTASKRIYQQRVGRVTRRHPGKESGIVVDFVHPATRHDDPVVTLHSLLDRDVYRGGAIVVGPVRRGRGRRVRVERRVIPVCAQEERRHEVFERELWRIAVEHLDWGEQHMWSALAGARVAPSGWRRARAMLHFDRTGELKRRFLLTAVERNKNTQLRVRALQEIAQSRDAEAFQHSVDIVGTWTREERREGVKVLLQALAERRIGRRDQASQWIWDLADMTREVHEEYAVQRWPETKRLLGLLVNSSGGAHARNARRLVHAARKQDRRLSAALLAAAVAHTPEAMEVVRGARTRMARKPSALSRELLRNFPKRKARTRRRRGKKDSAVTPELEVLETTATLDLPEDEAPERDGDADVGSDEDVDAPEPATARSRSAPQRARSQPAAAPAPGDADEAPRPARRRGSRRRKAAEEPAAAEVAETPPAEEKAPRPPRRRGSRRRTAEPPEPAVTVTEEDEAPLSVRRAVATEEDEAPVSVRRAVATEEDEAPASVRRRSQPTAAPADTSDLTPAEEAEAPEPARARSTRRKKADEEPVAAEAAEDEAPKPARARSTRRKKADEEPVAAEAAEDAAPTPARARSTRRKKADEEPAEAAPARKRAAPRRKTVAEPVAETAAPMADEVPKPARRRAPRKTAAATAAAEVEKAVAAAAAEAEAPAKPKRAPRRKATAAGDENGAAPAPRRRTTPRRAAAGEESTNGAEPSPAPALDDAA